MPQPMIKRDDYWADVWNSLFLRPVYRKPFPSTRGASHQAASSPLTVEEPVQDEAVGSPDASVWDVAQLELTPEEQRQTEWLDELTAGDLVPSPAEHKRVQLSERVLFLDAMAEVWSKSKIEEWFRDDRLWARVSPPGRTDWNVHSASVREIDSGLRRNLPAGTMQDLIDVGDALLLGHERYANIPEREFGRFFHTSFRWLRILFEQPAIDAKKPKATDFQLSEFARVAREVAKRETQEMDFYKSVLHRSREYALLLKRLHQHMNAAEISNFLEIPRDVVRSFLDDKLPHGTGNLPSLVLRTWKACRLSPAEEVSMLRQAIIDSISDYFQSGGKDRPRHLLFLAHASGMSASEVEVLRKQARRRRKSREAPRTKATTARSTSPRGSQQEPPA